MAPNKPVTPGASPAPPQSRDRWELAHQWRLAWRTIKWTAAGIISLLALLAVGQIYLFHQLFSDIHPALGWAFVVAVTGLCFLLIGAPLLKFMRAPQIAEPPNVNLAAPIVNDADLFRRFDFDAAYLKNMAANPALSAQGEAIGKARADLDALKKAGGEDIARKLAEFERQRIAPLLAGLDSQVDDYIHKEALAVGSATAISMNGSIDAFIVLWRNINMISRISRLYYGRPSLRLSLLIIRDVMVAVLLSRALDDISDAAGEALGGVMSKLGGLVAGPVMDGSVNALMTLKLGYLTKRRCRSFEVWSKASAARAVMDAVDQARRESASLTSEIVKLSGGMLSAAGKAAGSVAGVATGAAGRVAAAPRSAWSLVQNTFIKKPAPSKEG